MIVILDQQEMAVLFQQDPEAKDDGGLPTRCNPVLKPVPNSAQLSLPCRLPKRGDQSELW